MEIFRVDISCSLIYFVCNFILCGCISWTTYTILDVFSDYDCIPFRSILESANVPDVVTCGRMCYISDTCLGYWYQADTHQCSTLGDYADHACVWRRKQKINPGMLYYSATNLTFALSATIQRENSYYFGLPYNLTFNQAVAYCNEKNASIVVPETAEENKFLGEYLRRGRGTSIPNSDAWLVWLGMTNRRQEGLCEIRISGQPGNYSNLRRCDFYKEWMETCVIYSITRIASEEHATWIPALCDELHMNTLCEKRIEE